MSKVQAREVVDECQQKLTLTYVVKRVQVPKLEELFEAFKSGSLVVERGGMDALGVLEPRHTPVPQPPGGGSQPGAPVPMSVNISGGAGGDTIVILVAVETRKAADLNLL